MSTLHVENLKGLSSGSNANKIIVPSDQTLTAVGHVIQFKKFSGTAYVNVGSNGTYVTIHTDSTFSITPKFSNSLIVVRHYSGGLVQDPRNAMLRLQRNGTTILENDRHAYVDYTGWTACNWSFQYVDTPNSTSALTYTIQIRKDQGSVRANDYQATANTYVVTLEEIAQ